MSVHGRIHSVETCGTVDGPGIRFVVFTQGCPLRCLYCHNPDCRQIQDGYEVTTDELIREICKYKAYINSPHHPGGVTISGGEPLLQPEFVADLMRQCHEEGLHTALDTTGYTPIPPAAAVLEHTDLVLLDIKSFDFEIYQHITQVSLEPTLRFAQYLQSIQKPTWIRFVLVPGLSDALHNIEGLADFVSTLNNVQKVEVLPFHKMGEYKWEQLGYPYKLKQTPPASPEQVNTAVKIFQKRGLVTEAG